MTLESSSITSVGPGAHLRLAGVFGDHMVLQRRTILPVWGFASPGDGVHVQIGQDMVSHAVTDSSGRWSVELGALEASRELTLRVTTEHESITLIDIAVGEVWVAGGQSNMEFQIEFDADRESVLSGPIQPDIRFFDQPNWSYEGQGADHDYRLFGYWRRTTPNDLRYFSAVGYYFARALHDELEVPIGIIGCNWGGTPACAWADLAELQGTPAEIWIDDHEAGLALLDVAEEAAAFKMSAAADTSDPFADPVLYRLMRDGVDDPALRLLLPAPESISQTVVGSLHPNRPGGLFDTMVRLIAPVAVQGVIWYQGESDDRRAEVYDAALASVIRSWRRVWGRSLPFLMVQLAPFDQNIWGSGDAFPAVRRQQARVASEVEGVWMASTSDVGDRTDIHPKVKRPVGERLALLALGHVYGLNVLCDAPEPAFASADDHRLLIRFDHADGLVSDGPIPLQILNTDGRVLADTLQGEVIGDILHVQGQFVDAAEILFADTGYYEVGIRNGAGIPVAPFSIRISSDPTVRRD